MTPAPRHLALPFGHREKFNGYDLRWLWWSHFGIALGGVGPL